MTSPILVDKLFQGIKKQLTQIFDASFLSFNKTGITINIDDAIEYVNNIMDGIDKKEETEDLDYKDYLTLGICNFTIAFLVRSEEENTTIEAEAENDK